MMTELGRRVLIGLAVVSAVLLLCVALPFAEALLMAAVLASAFSPAFERLAASLRPRRTLAAAIFVTLVIFAVVLPLAGVVFAVAQQADDAFGPLRHTFQEKGASGMIESLPEPLPLVAKELMKRLPRGGQQLEELLRSMTGRILGGVGNLFVATGNLFFHLSMMLVGFFFMLVDGPGLVRWIIRVSPLTEEQMAELLSNFRDVSLAVLVGSAGTAFIQTCVALAGYFMMGTPHPMLLAAATFVGAFIPVVGAGAVVVISAVLMYFTGDSTAAILLGLWGIVVVSSIDNFVKPLLMRGRLEVNTGVTFFALLGGAAAFGPIGLLAGPLIVALFLAVVRMCQKELGPKAPPAGTGSAHAGDTV